MRQWVYDSSANALGYIESNDDTTQVFAYDSQLLGFTRQDGTFTYDGERVALSPSPGILFEPE